jgi:hypothetical protein
MNNETTTNLLSWITKISINDWKLFYFEHQSCLLFYTMNLNMNMNMNNSLNLSVCLWIVQRDKKTKYASMNISTIICCSQMMTTKEVLSSRVHFIRLIFITVTIKIIETKSLWFSLEKSFSSRRSTYHWCAHIRTIYSIIFISTRTYSFLDMYHDVSNTSSM